MDMPLVPYKVKTLFSFSSKTLNPSETQIFAFHIDTFALTTLVRLIFRYLRNKLQMILCVCLYAINGLIQIISLIRFHTFTFTLHCILWVGVAPFVTYSPPSIPLQTPPLCHHKKNCTYVILMGLIKKKRLNMLCLTVFFCVNMLLAATIWSTNQPTK